MGSLFPPRTLPVRSCLIDGEAIVCDENGLAVFELIRGTI
jgi:ATP-dependent DNA ligase